MANSLHAYGTLTLCGRPSQTLPLTIACHQQSPATPTTYAAGLGYSAFARHYSQNPLLSSPYLDVSVRTVPLPLTQDDAVQTTPGFPIRTPPTLAALCASSKLFAA